MRNLSSEAKAYSCPAEVPHVPPAAVQDCNLMNAEDLGAGGRGIVPVRARQRCMQGGLITWDHDRLFGQGTPEGLWPQVPP
jgi:hypothetical protein